VRRTLIALVLVGAACSSAKQTATPATTRVTLPPTTTTTSLTDCPVPRRNGPDPHRPVYALDVNVRPAEHLVTGTVSVKFTPDITIDRLVFRLWANNPRLAPRGPILNVGSVTIDGNTVKATLPDPTTLSVPLAAPLAGGRTVEATVAWDLRLPGPLSDRISQIGSSIRLGSFFPILGWEPGVGWATEPPATGFAEASTAPTADFAMHVVVPPGLDVLATGVPDTTGTTWRAEAVRDVALAIGHFRIARTEAASGVRVIVAVASDLLDIPEAYALKLKARLDSYATWFGAYAWPSYTVVITPGLRGGIEYPMFVMQGPNSLGRTTSHELGHQWFYALVGNDQGRDPWLDEGLATYAEVQAEDVLDDTVARLLPAETKGRLTSPIAYWNDHQRSYYAGVYVQGAQAVASLGSPDRVDCALRIYVARNAYGIARPVDLINAASVVFADAAAKLGAFGVTSSP
jgi:hypothetical protein